MTRPGSERAESDVHPGLTNLGSGRSICDMDEPSVNLMGSSCYYSSDADFKGTEAHGSTLGWRSERKTKQVKGIRWPNRTVSSRKIILAHVWATRARLWRRCFVTNQCIVHNSFVNMQRIFANTRRLYITIPLVLKLVRLNRYRRIQHTRYPPVECLMSRKRRLISRRPSDPLAPKPAKRKNKKSKQKTVISKNAIAKSLARRNCGGLVAKAKQRLLRISTRRDVSKDDLRPPFQRSPGPPPTSTIIPPPSFLSSFRDTN